MSVDKTDFGLVIYNHTNFYRFEETSSYWLVKRISGLLCLSLVNQRHASCITVYNRIVTNIENTVRGVHSCNSWFLSNFIMLARSSVLFWVYVNELRRIKDRFEVIISD